MSSNNGNASPLGARALTTATVQEIHLELIRRTERNNFDGAQVLADLMAHREDWRAVLFDTHGLASNGVVCGLIKLRDMADNFYNVDTLYILAVNELAAQRLAAFAEEWAADAVQVYDEEETNHRLGGCSDNHLCLVTMWWD